MKKRMPFKINIRSLVLIAVFSFLLLNIPIALAEEPEIKEGCTVVSANGNVTSDGRPVLCKVRDTSDKRQQLVFVSESPYDYIAVQSQGGPIFMGLNEAGLASGNAYVSTFGGSVDNSGPQQHILASYESIDQVRDYIKNEVNSSNFKATGCFPFIDARGNATMFEICRTRWWLEYNTLDIDREAQGLFGFVVRANEFHKKTDGTDDTSISGRYESGTYNIKGLVDNGMLCPETIIQGNDGANGFEFARYGPLRPLSTISRESTRSVISVHGVVPGEDPEMATMWVILGQSNYGISVPTWVKVSDIPPCLSSGDMYDRSKSLYNKGDELTTQASIFPVEAHMFDVVEYTLLPHFRANGVPSKAQMTRIEHQMANDSYSLLDCLDNRQSDNKAPSITFNALTNVFDVNFELIANDSDGTIESIEWNFGDCQTSGEHSPSHTYNEPGTYLVSCTVTDDDSVSITDWMYCTVPMGAVCSNLEITLNENGTTTLSWDGSSTGAYNIYVTEDYLTGFSSTSNYTVSGLSWTDMNATSNTQRYYDVGVNSFSRIEEPVGKLDYLLYKKSGGTGKNLISIPFETDIETASDLMENIGKSPSGNCTVINRWNSTSQESEGWLNTTLGIDFDILPFEAYEVWVIENTSWTAVGRVLEPDTIKLYKKGDKTGKNWLTLPLSCPISDASKMMDSIGKPPSGNCTVINRWNPVTQESEGWLDIGMGTNFNLVPGEGYEVWVLKNTSWTPF